jgi:hypothetical protein
VLLVAALAVALATAPAPADVLRTKSFRTPSGNIECGVVGPYETLDVPAQLVCLIRSGLRPEPRCEYEGDPIALTLGRRGPVQPGCLTDYPLGTPPQTVLAYGERWRRGAWRCLSEQRGVTCRNASDRGFFLSRERWRRLPGG